MFDELRSIFVIVCFRVWIQVTKVTLVYGLSVYSSVRTTMCEKREVFSHITKFILILVSIISPDYARVLGREIVFGVNNNIVVQFIIVVGLMIHIVLLWFVVIALLWYILIYSCHYSLVTANIIIRLVLFQSISKVVPRHKQFQ